MPSSSMMETTDAGPVQSRHHRQQQERQQEMLQHHGPRQPPCPADRAWQQPHGMRPQHMPPMNGRHDSGGSSMNHAGWTRGGAKQGGWHGSGCGGNYSTMGGWDQDRWRSN